MKKALILLIVMMLLACQPGLAQEETETWENSGFTYSMTLDWTTVENEGYIYHISREDQLLFSYCVDMSAYASLIPTVWSVEDVYRSAVSQLGEDLQIEMLTLNGESACLCSVNDTVSGRYLYCFFLYRDGQCFELVLADQAGAYSAGMAELLYQIAMTVE